MFGRPDVELNKDGAVWRFSNEGNRGAFALHPEVYTPRFGGYDPVAIGRDRSVPGHPMFWVVVGQRLYLFYSEQTRLAFLADPGRTIAAAERQMARGGPQSGAVSPRSVLNFDRRGFFRVAPGDECRHTKIFGGAAIGHSASHRGRHDAAGRSDKRVARRHVPFTCRAETRVDIGVTFCDLAKLDRRTTRRPCD